MKPQFLFNCDLKRSCLVYMFTLYFSESKLFEATFHSFPREYHIMS